MLNSNPILFSQDLQSWFPARDYQVEAIMILKSLMPNGINTIRYDKNGYVFILQHNGNNNYVIIREDNTTAFLREQTVHVENIPQQLMIAKIKRLPMKSVNPTYVHKERSEIESMGGKILASIKAITYAFHWDISHYFEGILVNGTDLYICPGRGYNRFSVEQFNNIMNTVANELLRLEIEPTAVIVDGRHDTETRRAFLEWQSMP